MLKKIIGLLSAFFLSFASFGFAQTTGINPMELPKFQDYVNDYSQVLDKSSRSELNQLAAEFEKYTGNTQIVTVLFPHRQGNELLEIGLKAFRENGIGQKDKNNGLLLLIATDEKKIRILVGYGLEGAIPDAKATEIINEKIRPRVNSGDYAQAIRNFYTASTEIIKREYNRNYTGNYSDEFIIKEGTKDYNETINQNELRFLSPVFLSGILAGIIYRLCFYYSKFRYKVKFFRGIAYLLWGTIFLIIFVSRDLFPFDPLNSMSFLISMTTTIPLMDAIFGKNKLFPRGGGRGGFGGGGFGGGGFSGGGGSSGGGGGGD